MKLFLCPCKKVMLSGKKFETIRAHFATHNNSEEMSFNLMTRNNVQILKAVVEFIQ